YDVSGKIRDVNMAKDTFQFAPRIIVEQSWAYIDKLPHETIDEIVEKYADINNAHPFLEGNGLSMRICLDCIIRDSLGKVVD
ncbi:Fic family protein, partial [Streptococcus suis]